jgi:hypothetical protein
MNEKVVAIGIDAPNARLLDSWLTQGLLPNIGRFAGQAVTCRYTHCKRFRNERCWDTLLSGRNMASSGSMFIPDHYGYFNESLQREDRYVPFYAFAKNRRVCMFDLPATLSPDVNGIQITGWGSELNASAPASQPAGLMAELLARHGPDPKLVRVVRVLDHKTGEPELSYVIPSLYDLPAVLDFKDRLLKAIERRTDICLDLLARDDWDLFVTVFPESHTANHLLWHLGEPHPLAALFPGTGHAVLENFQAIDAAIGRILDRLPAERSVVIYTIDHTTQNTMDVPGMALLPEFLYRWNFPGSQALAPGDIGQPVPSLRTDYREHWKHEVWAMRTEAGEKSLTSPARQEAMGDPLSWNPANWYRSLWPQMKAFALPSVADGYLRLNVQGRESKGCIEADRYHATLAEIGELLKRTTNPRTGRPLVKRLEATRKTPLDHPEIAPDLVVCWDDSSPADALDSPELGRIGPVPYFRTGGHVSHGTLIENVCFARGPGIVPGTATRKGKLEDLGATILHLMGIELPERLTGTPLVGNRRELEICT